jgi:hypothetical protein
VSALPGISGSLFPSRYLAAGLERDLGRALTDGRNGRVEDRRRRCLSWWRRLESRCGPATGLRELFDLGAMPLAAMLGFRARRARFERDRAVAHLESPSGAAVGLVVLPWAMRPPERWRDLTAPARAIGATWCLLVAPPWISIVEARGHAVRRSVDFLLPDALDDRSFPQVWTLLHSSAFEGEPVATLDALVARARHFQDAVREDLQHGVVIALDTLTPSIAPFDEALTLVYRILFLLFVEAHDLVPVRHPIFGGAYAMGTLCREALAAGRPAPGLWDGFAAITRISRVGCRHEDLIVRPFNGRLFARASAPSLERAGRSRPVRGSNVEKDTALARTLVTLATRPGRGGREEISYADLGVEQLGAVYERVLDLDGSPPDGSRHSRRRKESGTFYTPQPLAEFVVRRTLAPLVAGRTADEVLALRVVDPAMGSGAFLVAACRYLAAAYERALMDEGRISEADLRPDVRAGMRRLIAERCLAGVDMNPVAVQLARLSLWLTSLAAGKPLTFLDHRLRVGNSLVGASPDVLRRERPRSGAMRQRAKEAMRTLFDEADLELAMRDVVRPLGDLLARRDDSVDVIRTKEVMWNRLQGAHSPLEPWRRACDLWCAQWFWPPHGRAPSSPEIRAALDALLRNDRTLGAASLEAWLETARALARQVGFFHWPLEFADIFYDINGLPRDRPGFDAVIGNPPWEMLRAEGREPRNHEPRNPREPRNLGTPEPRNQLVTFLRKSSLYPSCDRGQVNLYQPFLERAATLARPGGRIGLILPWGLATDDGAASLRRRLFDELDVDALVGLENGAALFPIHRGLRFLVLVVDRPTVGAPPPARRTRDIRVRCGVRTATEIDALPDVDDPGDDSQFPVRLSRHAIAAAGGPARRIPDLRRPDDLIWLDRISRAHPALGSAGGWGLTFGRELNASDDRRHFGDRGLPVLEGKCIGPFRVDPQPAAQHVLEHIARRLLPHAPFDRPRLAYRDVSGAGNQRTLIAAILPAGAVTTHTLFCLRTPLDLDKQHYLCGLFNSYILNAVVRLLMGSHVTTSLVEGLPVPTWQGSDVEIRILKLARRLSRHPRSAAVEAALQATVARLYGFDAKTFAGILESFPLVSAADRERALSAIFPSSAELRLRH